jgi:TonB family protein
MHGGTGLAIHPGARLDGRQLRLLRLALLCSLAAHALALAYLSYRPEPVAPSVAPPPMTARIVRTPPPRAEPLASIPVPRPAAAARPAPARPAPPLAAAPILSVEPAKPAIESAPVVAAPPAAPAPLAPAAPVAVTVVRGDSQATAQPAAGPDPGTVARYRLELMDIARRYKRYPRIAQDNNWEGRVELRIAFAENGSITSLTVKKGTGRVVLDEEAQSMIRSAQPRATIPPALRGKAFVLEIPVDFALKEEGR